MVINRRAEFYAASFILGGGIRNVQIHKKTNSNQYIDNLHIGMCV